MIGVERGALRFEGRDGFLIFLATFYTLFGGLFVILGITGSFRSWSLWYLSIGTGAVLQSNAWLHWMILREVMLKKA